MQSGLEAGTYKISLKGISDTALHYQQILPAGHSVTTHYQQTTRNCCNCLINHVHQQFNGKVRVSNAEYIPAMKKGIAL